MINFDLLHNCANYLNCTNLSLKKYQWWYQQMLICLQYLHELLCKMKGQSNFWINCGITFLQLNLGRLEMNEYNMNLFKNLLTEFNIALDEWKKKFLFDRKHNQMYFSLVRQIVITTCLLKKYTLALSHLEFKHWLFLCSWLK